MISLVVSSKDVASLNIAKQILNHYGFRRIAENFQGKPIHIAEVDSRNVKLVTLNEDSVWTQNITDFFNGLELIVFISKHSSVSETPTLSVHTPGNLSEAKLGGLPRKVSVSPANTMRGVLKAMMHFEEKMRVDYEVSYECTHHRPFLNAPTMFAELGSSSRQWNDLKAAEVVAHATMEAAIKFGKSKATAVLGLGGPHYNGKFTRMALESEIAFSHMIPKYAIPRMDVEILRQCVEKTLEKVEFAVLDWEGISARVGILEEIGVSFQKG